MTNFFSIYEETLFLQGLKNSEKIIDWFQEDPVIQAAVYLFFAIRFYRVFLGIVGRLMPKALTDPPSFTLTDLMKSIFALLFCLQITKHSDHFAYKSPGRTEQSLEIPFLFSVFVLPIKQFTAKAKIELFEKPVSLSEQILALKPVLLIPELDVKKIPKIESFVRNCLILENNQVKTKDGTYPFDPLTKIKKLISKEDEFSETLEMSRAARIASGEKKCETGVRDLQLVLESNSSRYISRFTSNINQYQLRTLMELFQRKTFSEYEQDFKRLRTMALFPYQIEKILISCFPFLILILSLGLFKIAIAFLFFYFSTSAFSFLRIFLQDYPIKEYSHGFELFSDLNQIVIAEGITGLLFLFLLAAIFFKWRKAD